MTMSKIVGSVKDTHQHQFLRRISNSNWST